jgi:hypothetical protein
MPFSPDDRFERPAHVLARTVGDSTVLLDLQGEEYFGLDAVGSEAWELLTAGRTLGETVSAIAERYGEDSARVDADLQALLADLVETGLLAQPA